MKFHASSLAVALLASVSQPAMAQQATQLPPVDVDSAPTPAATQATADRIERDAIRAIQSNSSDTAALLSAIAGIAANTGGGFSSMPTIHGLSEQRLGMTVDGHPVDSACPNDMNTPLSYTDPQTVASIRVITGVAPVSLGGDSIGAIIAVNGPAPRFARGDGLLYTGEASAFFRSNDGAAGVGAQVTVASSSLSATYSGSFASAGRYWGGGNLGEVHSTEYRKTDHTLALAYQGNLGLIEIKGGYHYAPYEGFPNQYMDMTSNKAWFVNGHWHDDLGWAAIDLKGNYQAVDHRMNFLTDKGGTADGGMPMNTRVRSGGYTIKLDVPVATGNTVHLGHEYHAETLDDWWPPVAGSMMMGPDTYENINGGTRDRLGFYGELESKWGNRLSTLIGARLDRVVMNTGQVAPYGTGMMQLADDMAAMAFNAAGHRRADDNWSASALVSWAPASGVVAELGYAHKARSPNLYERYSWGTGGMSSSMIGWFGDGNGYIGNLDLKPERADTVSVAVTASGGGKSGWFVKVEPWYTHVNDYIDAGFVKNFTNMMGMPTGFSQLQFDNEEAALYGIDVSGAVPLWNGGALGQTRLTGSLAYVHGQNLTAHTPLYHQMPLDIKAGLTHRIGGFEGGIDLEAVSTKTRVDPARNEPTTPAYALVNLRTAYTWGVVRVSLDVENLFDKAYALPLGGISLGDYTASGGTVIRPVPGRGRSFNLGLSARF